jgi:hypothetical protein
LKTKFLLGAIAVAVLAVMGIVGFRQATPSEAGDILGVNGCNPSTVVQGGTCDFSITFYDDSTNSGITATATGGTLLSLSVTPSCGPGDRRRQRDAAAG